MKRPKSTAARPAIPADIKRRVLIEAGHRCAIPTCRYIEVELHHIVPWAKCHAHEYDNLIALCANCHRRADRGEIDRQSLRLYKFNLRFAHDKYSQLELDLLFDLAKHPDGAAIDWLPVMLPLVRRIVEAQLVQVWHPNASITTMGVNMTPVRLRITAEGRAFITDLGLDEL